MSPTIGWASADRFAEIAKALGVTPELIMAAYGGGTGRERGLITVLYTPAHHEGDDPPVWSAMLWRDEDSGELKVERNQYTGRHFSSFMPPDDIEARLRSAFGDPSSGSE